MIVRPDPEEGTACGWCIGGGERVVLAVLICSLPLAVPGGPWVGFVDHTPFLALESPQYAESGATLALVRVSWATVQPDAESWDFSSLDQQLEWAEAQNIRLMYVFEVGPAHAPNWLRAECRAAGEMTAGPGGSEAPDPCLFSPLYHRRIDAFVARSTRYLRDHPKSDRILAYNNGCEWWYPDLHAHGELDRAAFEAAMIARYGSRSAARRAWGLPGDGPLGRPPVILEGGAGRDHFAELVALDERFDGCLMTSGEHIPVEPGRRYTLEAEARVTDRQRGAAYVQIAWLGDAPAPLRVVNSTMTAGAGWARIAVSDTAPAGARRAWLLLKTCAVGRTQFRGARFGPEGETAEWPVDQGWITQTWLSPEPEQASYEIAGGVATIDYHRRDTLRLSDRWVDDWFDFMGGAVAEFIGGIADRIRAVDQRPIVTYLTMSFASPFGWDDSYGTHVHPHRVFAARQYDGLGMQLASADGDFHHVTAAVDAVRRHGEPWLIDLQDFTAGIHVGREAMTATTLAGIEAGARGVVYYGWYDRFVPDYSFGDGWPIADTRAMVAAAKARLSELSGTTPPIEVAVRHPMVPPLPGRGEPDPGRLMLLYKALRALELGVVIVAPGEEPPPGVPLLTVEAVPEALRPEVLRSTEAGNTPPMFKFVPSEANRERLAALVERLRASLGR